MLWIGLRVQECEVKRKEEGEGRGKTGPVGRSTFYLICLKMQQIVKKGVIE